MSPKVEIIILNYNGKDDTLECLASLRKLDYPYFHITVVDNGSSDGLRETVKSEFPEIDYIYSDINLRFAGGNNLAIKEALTQDYDYILLLNNDTVAAPDFLRYLVETCECDEHIGMAGPKMYYFRPPNVIWFAGGRVDIRFAYMRHIGIGKKDDGSFDNPGCVGFLNGACVLIKTETLRQIGLFDEGFFLYGEDLDLCIRAVNAGWKLYFQPKAKIWHKVSRSTPKIKKLIYRYESWLGIIKKHTKFYWRPFQIANLLLEFIPLAAGYIARMVSFKRSGG